MRPNWKLRLASLLAALVLVGVLLSSAGTASATPGATVLTVANVATTSQLNVGVAIPHSLSGKSSWGVDVTVTYLSVNNTIVTVDSGVVPLQSTQLIGSIDKHTDAVQFNFSYAGSPAPGNQPSYTGTATLVKL